MTNVCVNISVHSCDIIIPVTGEQTETMLEHYSHLWFGNW